MVHIYVLALQTASTFLGRIDASATKASGVMKPEKFVEVMMMIMMRKTIIGYCVYSKRTEEIFWIL